MRYVDFDSHDLAEYPDVRQKVKQGSIEPGAIMIEGKLVNIWEISYTRLLAEFERLGAKKQ